MHIVKAVTAIIEFGERQSEDFRLSADQADWEARAGGQGVFHAALASGADWDTACAAMDSYRDAETDDAAAGERCFTSDGAFSYSHQAEQARLSEATNLTAAAAEMHNALHLWLAFAKAKPSDSDLAFGVHMPTKEFRVAMDATCIALAKAQGEQY